MKQKAQNIVILDIGSANLKGLLGSFNNETSEKKAFFELQGAVHRTNGLSNDGIVRNKKMLSESVEHVCETLSSFSGYDIENIYVLHTNPNTRLLTKTIGINAVKNPEGVYITEEWIRDKQERIKTLITKTYKQEVCTYFTIQSIIADGEEIIHDNPYEHVATGSIQITYSFTLTPAIFTENMRESIEKVANTKLIQPTAIANGFFLTNRQRERGAILCDIGANFTAITVCRDNTIIGIHTIPFGGNTITDIIALKQKIAIEEAEELKCVLRDEKTMLKKRDTQSVNKKITDILKKNLTPYIHRIDPKKNFPGGIVLIGGGSRYPYMEQIIEKLTGLHAVRAKSSFHIQSQRHNTQDTWQSAYAMLQSLAAQTTNTGFIKQQKQNAWWHQPINWMNKISRMIH